MNRYLLDTNICISMFKDKYGIRQKILDVSLKNCFVSEITIAELFFERIPQIHLEDWTK